jgi:hypothetical protein
MPQETKPVKRNIIFLGLATTALGALALGYGLRLHSAAVTESPSDLLELAPADAVVIAYADLAVLRQSPLAQRLAAMAQPSSVGSDYAAFVRATGFDYQRDLDRAVLATHPGSPAAQTLVFAAGRFDQKKIEEYALHSGKLEQESGHPVYVTPSVTPGKNVSLTFLSTDRMALADGGDLSVVLAGGSRAPLDPALQERLARVAGAPLFVVAKAPAAGFTGSARTAGAASSFDALRWLSLAARPEGDHVLLSVEGECDSLEKAQELANALEFLRSLARGALADPKARGQMPAATAEAVSQLFQAAVITTDVSRVRVLVTVTPGMLGAAAAPAGR